MKILIVMTGFFPGQKFGGPPVSVNNFCSLMSEHECYIVTRNHDLGDKETYTDINEGWNDRGNCKVKYLPDDEYSYKSFEKAICELRPDLIYLQGLFQNCILPCLHLGKKYNVPVLLAPRGELCKGAFKKKYKKVPYIIFAKVFGLLREVSFQSTSDEETEAIVKHLGVDRKKIWYLTNIPSIPVKEYSCNHKDIGSAKFIYLSRIVPKKNLDYAIEVLRSIKGNVQLDIYGANEDETYWDLCTKLISNLPGNIKVSYNGNLSHDEVAATFANYDAMLFPTKSENFGHAIVEALSVGCPVIISDQTPWTDLADYNAGWAISLDEKEKFVDAVQNVINENDDDRQAMHKGAKKYFSDKLRIMELKKAYLEALEGSIKN